MKIFDISKEGMIGSFDIFLRFLIQIYNIKNLRYSDSTFPQISYYFLLIEMQNILLPLPPNLDVM